MKLSFLIPVYNVEKYLSRCLDSVVSQIDNDCEVIIVDDGSTDNSGQICLDYANKYSNSIKFFQKENQGAYPTRNYALDRSNGDYVWLIDPDDYIQEGAVEKIFEIIEKYSNPQIISMSYKRFNDNEYKDIENCAKEEKVISGEEYLKDYTPNPYLWSKVYNREFLIKNHLRFNDKLNTQGDWLFNMYAFSVVESMCMTNIYAYNYYKGNPTSTLNNKSQAHRRRGVENSMIAQTEFNNFIKSKEGTTIYPYLKNWQSLTESGFFYSMYRICYPISDIKKVINKYKQEGMYPINKGNNQKSNKFISIANIEWLYLLLCKLHRRKGEKM